MQALGRRLLASRRALALAARVELRASSQAPLALRSAPQQRARQLAARAMSSSRFQSLADDDDEGKRKRKGREDGEDEEEEDDAELQDGELLAEGEDGEQDGDLELEDDDVDVNEGGVDLDEELDDEVMRLYLANPVKWTPEKLARTFHLSKPRVEALLYLKADEAGLTPDEFRAKVAAAAEQAKQEMEAHAKLVEAAKAKGDEKELRRLLKRERQGDALSEDFEYYADFAIADDAELSEHERALLFGLDEDAYRNPDFFFLSDEYDGLPPLVRRLGKHGSTDQLQPAEAKELQRLAANNKVELLKSFANPENAKTPAKFRLAVKDISKKKKPLYVRDESHKLRLATDDEVLRRSWVRRPPFFGGLDA